MSAITKFNLVSVVSVEEIGYDHYTMEAILDVEGKREVATITNNHGNILSLTLTLSSGELKDTNNELCAYLSGVADLHRINIRDMEETNIRDIEESWYGEE